MDEVFGGNPGRAVQRRAVRRDGWSQKARAIFLDSLAATANATLSARKAGLSHNSAYSLRRRDPTFAAQWQEALAAAYVRLETELLGWALRGSTPDYVPGETEDEESAAPQLAFDPAEAMRVLTRHQMRAEGSHRTRAALTRYASMDEVHAELRKRLDAIAKRDGGKP